MQLTVRASALQWYNHPSIHSLISQDFFFLSICMQCKCQEIAHYLLADACHLSINPKTAAPPPVILSTDCSSLKIRDSIKVVCTGNCTFYNYLVSSV